LVVADVQALKPGQSTLSLFTNENGGIMDDTVINNQDSQALYVVSNAGSKDKILAHIRKQLESMKKSNVKVDVLDLSLIALQGPKAISVLENLTEINKFEFMTARRMEIKGIPVYISRCGYTGEDGFEVN
jgi:aminomethyltransferase